jgi:Putative polyhydroxyalkanoic acid system protein (PHA_gran_rgn)
MSLVSITIQHGRTQEEACRRLEAAVHEVSTAFGAMVRRVQWDTDRTRVRLEGIGFWIELWIDAVAVHATADAPILGRLLGSRMGSRLKEIVEHTFRKQLR